MNETVIKTKYMIHHDLATILEHQPYKATVPITFALAVLTIFTKGVFLFFSLEPPTADSVRWIQAIAGILTIFLASVSIAGILIKWWKEWRGTK